MVEIVGMAGVGKSELAIQYGRAHLKTYLGGVAWFSAVTFGTDLRNWLQEAIVQDQDLRHLPELTQQVTLGWKEWQNFCGDRPALVIVDDVTDYRAQVEPYLPQELDDPFPFCFLLTSRIRSVSVPPIPILAVQELELEDAVIMLGRFAGEPRIMAERDAAVSLCQRLAYLPLAIALVGCWLRVDEDRTLSDLITSLEREGLDAPALERDAHVLQLTAEKGLMAAFAVSWQQAAASYPSAQQLARVLTLFAPVDIAWALVVAVAQTYDRLDLSVAQTATSEPSQNHTGWLRFLHWLWQQIQRWLGRLPSKRPPPPASYPIADPLEARGTLLRLNLIQRVDHDKPNDQPSNASADHQDDAPVRRQYRTGPAYRLHPLLREFFENQWSDTDREGWQLAFALAMGDQASRVPQKLSWEDAAIHHDANPHFPIAEKILTDRAKASADADTRRRYRAQSNTLSAASFRLAKPVLFEATLARARKTYDEAKALAQAGNSALASQKFTQTLEDYQQTIYQARKTFPNNSLQLAGYLNQIACIFRELGQYQEGISPATEAVSIATDRVSPIKFASYLNVLGLLHVKQGNYSEAEPLLERSLAIRETQLGRDHPDVATSLNDLALLYRSQGHYSEAEPLFGRSLNIWETQLGEDHPTVASSLNNLAQLYYSQGRYSEAEPLLRRSLFIGETQLGEDHPDVAFSLNNLAGVYQAQGRYSKAEPLLRRSLSIGETQLGEDHPDVASSLNNLAGVYQAQGRYSKAEPLYGRSLSIMETQLGEDHPDVASHPELFGCAI